jgi:alpha-galactosidase
MKITFQKEKKIFRLENRNFLYVFFVDEEGYLRHLYAGKPIAEADFSSSCDFGFDWAKTYLSRKGKEEIYADDYYSDRSLLEIGSEGKNDKRGSLIALRQDDGSFYTDFVFEGYRIFEGLPTLRNLPFASAGKEAQSLELTLREVRSGLTLKLTYSLLGDLPLVLRTSVLTNRTKKTAEVRKAMSLQLDLPENGYDLLHFYGTWARERNVERRPLGDGLTVIESRFGRSSHEENPFTILAEKNTDENQGSCFGFNLLYSGDFRFAADCGKAGDTRVLLGISDTDFSYPLKPKETLELPQGVIGYSSSGFNGLSQTFHDFIRDHLIRFKKAKERRPLIFNSWEGCYMDFDTEKILAYLGKAKEIGAELFVMDDGWFGKRNSDNSSLGDWEVNTEKIDLHRVADTCHREGMKFGLWFEPEMVNPDSDFYRSHPHCSLGHEDEKKELSRHQLALDLTDDKIVDEIAKKVNKILDTYPIDYVKWDNNRTIADNYSYHLGKDDQGKVSYLLTVGFYKLCKKIIDRHPDIFFEGCASGGGRFDLGMLAYFPQIWCSDETDPVQRLYIQYGTSYGYPLSTMGSHVSKSSAASYKTKCDIALFGTYGYEFDPTKLSEEEKKQLSPDLDLYHGIASAVIQNGDLYRLRSPFTDGALSWVSVSKKKDKALFLYVTLRKQNSYSHFVKLVGLDPKKRYGNSLDHKVYSGDYYENVGLNLSFWMEEFQSTLIVLTEAEHD